MKPTFIIPYRNRLHHLKRLAMHLLPIGNILVIEQADTKPFNRGKLLNLGFQLADLSASYPIFHDVDMLPFNRECYNWTDGFQHAVYHLAGKCSQFKYQMPYPEYIGGVTAFSPDNFELINGFSNDFWGWGGEDDDLRNRILAKGLGIIHLPCRFQSLAHPHNYEEKTHKENVRLLNQGPDFESGLSSMDYESLTEFEFTFAPQIQAFSVKF